MPLRKELSVFKAAKLLKMEEKEKLYCNWDKFVHLLSDLFAPLSFV
jgi:hypothetical protein